ncbi:P-loop containing nucleoside triphosphate hydrolase protein [Auriculariales sp. MPI-PUGE-AT-0066]|nr:P-loop containing nucleoside triphosphate hydrolase protein [Auriculariales sp. MPI-PUGE-AT-0066]
MPEVLFKVDGRLSVGIFIKGLINWEEAQEQEEIEDPVITRDGSLQIRVCSFEFQSSEVMSTYKPCPPGFRLHARGGRLQLYNKNIANTFVFMGRPAVGSDQDVITSIALQNFSQRVQKQIGRVNRAPVGDIEIHVISNRDRLAHQDFDLRFEHVQTEEILRDKRDPRHYQLSTLREVDWADRDDLREVFTAEQGDIARILEGKTTEELDRIVSFGVQHRAEHHLFWIFEFALERHPTLESSAFIWMDESPELAYAVLKRVDPSEHPDHPIWSNGPLPLAVIRNIIRGASKFGIASLVALEKLKGIISSLPVEDYAELLYLAAICVRGTDVAREVLLVLHDVRSDVPRYTERQLLALVTDRAEEAFDECPLYENGAVHRRAKGILTRLVRSPDAEDLSSVSADIRVDRPSTIRLHSHVRLQAANAPDGPHVERLSLDGVVSVAARGQLRIKISQPLPPEFRDMDWDLYDAGSVATTRAMLDAVVKLATEGRACCRLADLIMSSNDDVIEDDFSDIPPLPEWSENVRLNASQQAAVNSVDAPLSLIWGPPGTGKTTVVLDILERFIRGLPDCKVLLTASTHNAVDNVLERFAARAITGNLLPVEQIIRVSTDVSKVNKSLHRFTIDAMLGGSPTDDPKLVKRAEERVKNARIVFSTCAGAGLGILRKVSSFDVVVVDEASQVTEPATLIPLVKGCQRAVLVGDHVQLRPMARKMSVPLLFDVSLMERLYTGPSRSGMRRTMLDVQYRFPRELAEFPSNEFYQGRLQTGPQTAPALPGTFPWPRAPDGSHQIGTIFVPSAAEEDIGRSSKSNKDQAELVKYILSLIMSDPDAAVTCAVLTPYAAQQKLLRTMGREADVVIYSTVRCNVSRDIGFLQDARRLNVVWTRARHALVVVGDADTLRGVNAVPTERSEQEGALEAQRLAHSMWGRALDSCTRVEIHVPEVTPSSGRV